MSLISETDVDRLGQTTSPGELIRSAIAFETQAEAFYASLREQVRPGLRALVEELVHEERRHKELLVELDHAGHLPVWFDERIESPSTLTAFDAMAGPPNLPENPSDDDILDYALARERLAAQHYAALAASAVDPKLRATFVFLAEEESNHVVEIAARWARLSSS